MLLTYNDKPRRKVMELKAFIGVDVSKNTLDFAVSMGGKIVLEKRVENNLSGIKSFNKEFVKRLCLPDSQLVYCMEHTGIYCNHLLDYLTKQKIAVCLENPLAIKAFFGMARGKNDQLDARRIAEYAYSKRDKIKLWTPPREIIKKIKNLLLTRERLVKVRKSLTVPVQEADRFVDKDFVKMDKRIIKPIVEKLNSQIKVIEQQLEELIKEDTNVNNLNKVVRSVVGVGPIVSANVIVATNEFKNISDPKKMACHSGVAPFRYTSGITIKSKAKVSHKADKNLKSLFFLAARAAVTAKGELREYYDRKVKEGKNKMSVFIAVANKIIRRIFSCVKRNEKYEKIFVHPLAKP